jgi:hypothetical protein
VQRQLLECLPPKLYAIKNGSSLWVAVADRVLYQADLTGSAKAMNRAWTYVEQRLPDVP